MEKEILPLDGRYAHLRLGPSHGDHGEVDCDSSGSQALMKKKAQGQAEISFRCPSTSHRFRGLVLGDALVGSYIRHELKKRGYNFSLVTSREDAADLVHRNDFGLIVSTMPLEHDDPLLSKLSGSRCTVVSYQPAERVGCWLPVMSHGEKCFGAPALCPADFIGLVDRIVTELNGPPANRERDSGKLARTIVR